MNKFNERMFAVAAIAVIGLGLTSCGKTETPPSTPPSLPPPTRAEQPAPVVQPSPPPATTPSVATPPVAKATPDPVASKPLPTTLASLTAGEMNGGLKEALANGIQKAIEQLGKEGGFLNNLDVKIPMPENLQKIEKTLRTVGQGSVGDEFIATMNRAARCRPRATRPPKIPPHPRGRFRLVATACRAGPGVLFVVHCERGENFRIISARRATRREREPYERRRDD